MPTAADFESELDAIFRDGKQKGLAHVDVKAGDLHRGVGGYPGHNHRMPVCCEVMLRKMKTGDTVLNEPPKGKGASLELKYKIPR